MLYSVKDFDGLETSSRKPLIEQELYAMWSDKIKSLFENQFNDLFLSVLNNKSENRSKDTENANKKALNSKSKAFKKLILKLYKNVFFSMLKTNFLKNV